MARKDNLRTLAMLAPTGRAKKTSSSLDDLATIVRTS